MNRGGTGMLHVQVLHTASSFQTKVTKYDKKASKRFNSGTLTLSQNG